MKALIFNALSLPGRIGGVKVEAGRNNTALGLGVGNILSNRTDAVKLGFGKDLKVDFQYGKISSGHYDYVNGKGGKKADKYMAATLGGEIGNLGLNAGYVKAMMLLNWLKMIKSGMLALTTNSVTSQLTLPI